MGDEIKSIEYKGYTINIYPDEDPMNPRTEYDNLGHMICFHRRYDLGDKHKLSVEEAQEMMTLKNIVFLPLYLYDHSGITMSYKLTYPFTDRWDAGQVGFIYVYNEEIRKEYGKVTAKTKKQALEVLKGEVEDYDNYITGNVYGFVVRDRFGENVESVWGFSGDTEYAIDEAKGVIDHIVKSQSGEAWGE